MNCIVKSREAQMKRGPDSLSQLKSEAYRDINTDDAGDVNADGADTGW